MSLGNKQRFQRFRFPTVIVKLIISFDLDIDECVADLTECDVNADCRNTEGSFTCACKAGFTGNGTSCKGNYKTIVD